jgi:hypothetical protein
VLWSYARSVAGGDSWGRELAGRGRQRMLF